MKTSHTILFKATDLRWLINTAMKASHRSPTLTELDNPDYHIGGVVKRDATGEVDVRNIDYAQIPPCLWLVKDAGGIYMVSNAKSQFNSPVDVSPAYAQPSESNGDGVLSKREADRLLGKSRFWMAIPAQKFVRASWRSQDLVAVEIVDQPLSLFERLRRLVGELVPRKGATPTVVVSLNR